ncbi:polysaccharide biosynthesis protein [Epilithonimonas sp.]|uniref:lipopolysaccharide biosynthesis protein n=1 Tax=Epilithonimonas sp. TaxID=2894511 RepID=UPI00289E00ED|nr:polysaccharide biosynthesis protein [Epilithonimonas sp.]
MTIFLDNFKKKLLGFGVDGSVFYTVMGRFLQGLGGLFTVILVAQFLSKSEQGYYFTFSSILAIQIFFELGLSGIIVQFIAHEMSDLYIENNGTSISGNGQNLSRLSSLLKFSVKWFFIMAIVLLVVLVVSGFCFFSNFGKDTNDAIVWKSPWVIISLSTSFSLIISPFLSFFEGIGQIKDVAKFKLIQITLQLLLLVFGLYFGWKLFAYPIANFVSILILPLCIIFSSKIKILKDVWKKHGTYNVDYKKEIFPLQWKISLSWISGYFIYQLFNPVIFAYEGAVVAGQMGVSLAIINGVLLVSLSWVNTKIPVFSTLIARKEYQKLDALFRKTLFHSTSISIIGITFVILSYCALKYFQIDYYKRFLPLGLFSTLIFGFLINQVISSLAIYLRCHKKEPLLVYSVVSAILICFSTLFVGKFLGIKGIIYGFSFLIVFFCFPWALYIFLKKRKEWH